MLKKNKSKDLFTNNLNYYILNGILFALVTSLAKTYAPKFLDRIHGTPFHFTLFNALPGFIAIFATIPSIFWMSKTSNIKLAMAKMFFSSRFFILLYIAVPFLPIDYQPMTFVVLTSLMNFPEAVSVTALQSFSGDIFIQNQRATAISMRNKFSTLAQILAMLILGKILTIKGIPNDKILFTYQILFLLAFIIGMFEIKTFFKLKETCSNVQIPSPSIDFKTSLKSILKNKKFNFFMLCSLLFHFGWQMGWPLFTIYQIQYLGAEEGWLTIIAVSSNIVMFFSFNYWNKLIQTKGNPFVIAITTLGMAITPILFALSPNLIIITITSLITGFFTAGTITVILSSLLEVVPENQRALYVGIHATFTNITLAVGPMIGNAVLNMSNIYVALVVTAGFRLIGSIAFFIRNKHINKSTLVNN